MEIYVNGIVHIALSLWGIISIYLLFEVFYESSNISNKTKIILFGIYSLITDMSYFMLNIPIVTMLINVCCLLFIAYKYKKDIKKSIIFVLIVYLSIGTIEMLVLGLVKYEEFFITSSNALVPLEYMFITRLVTFVLVLIVSNFKIAKENYKISYKQCFIIMFVSMIAIYVVIILLGHRSIGLLPRTIAIGGMIIINISIIYLYINVAKDSEKRLKLALYEKENEYYKNQFNMLEKSSKKDREVKHNLTNILLVLRGAVNEENKTTATKHIESMIDNYNQKEYIKTGIPTIDSVINFKIGKAIENQINYQVKVVIPIDIEVDFIDVGIVLGNLLDNAIEATSKLDIEKRMLKLDIKYEHKRIGILVENTFNGELKYRKGQLISIKDDSNNHGIGLKSVKNIAKKYGDYICIDNTDDKFIVKLSIEENQP